MKQLFKVLTGTATEIELKLNKLSKEYIVNIQGVNGVRGSMVVIVDIFKQ